MGRKPADPRARVRLLPGRSAPWPGVGATRSMQEAEVEVPAGMLEEIWRPEYLERLAHAYWRHLSRVSAGLLRIEYEPDARSVVLLARPLVLLRFRAPAYAIAPGLGQVTWPIDRGLLVAADGRGRGYLRIRVRQVQRSAKEGPAVLRVSAEVANYYPLLHLRGRLARVGAALYAATQLRLHVWFTRRFLRSLGALDLRPSPVGTLREDGADGAGGIRR